MRSTASIPGCAWRWRNAAWPMCWPCRSTSTSSPRSTTTRPIPVSTRSPRGCPTPIGNGCPPAQVPRDRGSTTGSACRSDRSRSRVGTGYTPASSARASILQGQSRLGRELHLGQADPSHTRSGRRSSIQALGQVQLPVDEVRPPVAAGVGQKDPDLRVLDPPGGAGVLPWPPRRTWLPFFKNPVSSITNTADESPRYSDHVLPQVVADRVGVPLGVVEQPLHPIRRRDRRPARTTVQPFLRSASESSPRRYAPA